MLRRNRNVLALETEPEKDLIFHKPTKRSEPQEEQKDSDSICSERTIKVKVDVDTSDVDKALEKYKELMAFHEAAGNINNSIIDVTDMSDKDKEKLVLQGYTLMTGRVLAVKKTNTVCKLCNSFKDVVEYEGVPLCTSCLTRLGIKKDAS